MPRSDCDYNFHCQFYSLGDLKLKIGLIQSCYLPWRGYFDFIDDVDVFIFHDDVQYTRQDWRNRNLIKTSHGKQWITVPVIYSHKVRPLICEARIDYSQLWQKKHMNLIREAYRAAPYFEEYAEEFFKILSSKYEFISELNIALTSWLMSCFSIKVSCKISTDFKKTETMDKTSRIIEILSQVGCSEYLSGPAAKSYINETELSIAGISVSYKAYEYLEYPQLHGDFEPNLSAIDLLFCCGPHSRPFLKSTSPNIRA